MPIGTKNYQLCVASAVMSLLTFAIAGEIGSRTTSLLAVAPFYLVGGLMFGLAFVHWFHVFWMFDSKTVTTTKTANFHPPVRRRHPGDF